MFQPTTILHPTDFSDAARSALPHAVHLARRHDAALHVIHVLTVFGGDPIREAYEAQVDIEGFERALRAAAASEVDALLDTVDTAGLNVTTTYDRGVAAAPVILEHALDRDADLIVMGTHGRRGVKRFMLGSVTEEVARCAPCSVLTVQGDTEHAPSRIDRVLVPVDLSDMTETLLQTAGAVAASFAASLDVLHVVEPLPFSIPMLGGITLNDLLPDPRDRAQEVLDTQVETVARSDVAVRTHVAQGKPDLAILQMAGELDTDLIVIASHDASRVERVFLGSTTSRVVRRSTCPVLIARLPTEDEAPPAAQARRRADSSASSLEAAPAPDASETSDSETSDSETSDSENASENASEETAG
jgi:nucleotide-binding universal stress UspA family protein